MNKDVYEEYVLPSVLYGIPSIIAADKALKARNECFTKAYADLDKAYDEYKKRVEYNNKWYRRFTRFISNWFKL